MSMKDALNRANPNHIADILQKMKFGDHMRGSMICRLYRQNPSAPVPLDQIAAVHTIKLPFDAKASYISRACAIAGTGTLGELICDVGVMGSATAAGHAGVTHAGDLSFAAADDWSSVDVEYMPMCTDNVLALTLPVASNDIVLPTWMTDKGVLMLMRATLDTGTVTGEGKIVAPGSRSATTLQVNLNAAKTTVQFVAADAVTKATLWLALAPSANLDTFLKSSEGSLL